MSAASNPRRSACRRPSIRPARWRTTPALRAPNRCSRSATSRSPTARRTGDVRAVRHVDLALRAGRDRRPRRRERLRQVDAAPTARPAAAPAGGDHRRQRHLPRPARRRRRRRRPAAGAQQLRALRWREIAIVFQSAMNALNPVLRVRDQLGRRARRAPAARREQRHDRLVELLDLVGIPRERLRSYPHELSGGMRQRVMIAMALAVEPEVVIMDEPTTALDVVVQREILAEIAELKERLGFSVLFITHDLSLLLEIADRIVIMYAGQLVESGTGEQIHTRSAHPYTRGLLDSFPRVHGPRRKLAGIPGSPPDLRGALAGCPFIPRCRFATEACGAIDMALIPVDPGHLTRVPVRHRREARRQPGRARGDHRGPASRRRRVRRARGGRSDQGLQARPPRRGGRGQRRLARAAPRHDRRAGRRERLGQDHRREAARRPGEADRRADPARRRRRSTPPPGAGSAPTRARCRWSSRTRSPRSTRCTRCATTSSARCSLHRGRTGRAPTEAELDALLEQVRLTPPEQFRDAYPHELSGGQRQRVAIARALAA